MDSLRMFKWQILVVVLFLAPICAYGYFKDSLSHKTAHLSYSSISDLGITLDEFKMAYNQKAYENELPSLSLPYIPIEDKNSKSKAYYSYSGDVVIMFDIAPSSKHISKILVCSSPFQKNIIKSKKVRILALQSVVWGFAAMVFSSTMENQWYRESVLKKIISERNVGYMISGNIKIASTQVDDILMFSIEPKN